MLSNFNILEISLLSILAGSLFVQLFYYLFFYLRIAFYKKKEIKTTKELTVSVVVCAKNEAENLEKFLPLILRQKYTNYEVIVVNDRSTDDTETILKRLKAEYNNLYVTSIPISNNTQYNKKLALTIGLKAARNEYILLTDADCKPISDEWISNMISQFNEKTDIVIGYGSYQRKKGFLNRIIRYDTLTTAMKYLSFAMSKVPYMGVGRNMAYRKLFFTNKQGFASHLNILSGDDDLFINENANSRNLKVMINPESFTESIPEQGFQTWFYQKKRHLCSKKYYKTKHKILLGLELFSRFSFYLSFIVSLFFSKIIIFAALIGFAVRFVFQHIVLSIVASKLKERGVVFLALIFDILMPIINLFAYFKNKKFCNKR